MTPITSRVSSKILTFSNEKRDCELTQTTNDKIIFRPLRQRQVNSCMLHAFLSSVDLLPLKSYMFLQVYHLIVKLIGSNLQMLSADHTERQITMSPACIESFKYFLKLFKASLICSVYLVQLKQFITLSVTCQCAHYS